jgi:hypothetical protein
MTVRIDRIVTSGVFSLDGQDFAVDNNVWLVGNDREVLVIDAAHDAEAILESVGSRTVKAIVSTHGHTITSTPRGRRPSDRRAGTPSPRRPNDVSDDPSEPSARPGIYGW